MAPAPKSPLDAEPLRDRVATGLHKLGLALKHQTWVRASAEGLSPTQGQILASLSTEGALSTSEVAARLGVTLPTISEAVTALVSKQLVRRAPDPRHPRARLLHLTAAGARHATRAQMWPELLATAVESLTDGEQTTLLTALMKMIRTLQEEGRIPTHRMCATCLHFRPRAHRGDRPHHCAFVDSPMADHQLRLECTDHVQAAPAQQAAAWARFADGR